MYIMSDVPLVAHLSRLVADLASASRSKEDLETEVLLEDNNLEVSQQKSKANEVVVHTSEGCY